MVFFNGCKKIDSPIGQHAPADHTGQFFHLPASTHASVARVAAALQNRNTKLEFVNRFASQNGFPVWDKAIFKVYKKQSGSNFAHNNGPESDSLAYIPLVLQDSNHVNGYILATLGDTLQLTYSLASDYKAYPNTPTPSLMSASQFTFEMLRLNKNVFGNTKYKITDPKLFSTDTIHKKTTQIILNAPPDVNLASVNTNECWLITWLGIYCGTPNYPGCKDADGCDLCGTYCRWEESSITICTGGGSAGGGGGGGGSPLPGEDPGPVGGGGGGNDLPHYYPCPGTGNPFTAPICPPPGGGIGWVPLPLEEEPTYTLLDYTDLENPIFIPDDIVLMPPGFNFQFQGFTAVTDPPVKTIGKIAPRGNSEDMDWGYNGDASGILSMMPNFTDQQLFDEVEDLFHKTSTGVLQTVGDNMLDRFRNTIGGIYSNSNLSQKVFENSKFKEFIVKFGVRLNQALENANWNIDNVGTIEIPTEDRPIFNGLHNKFNGLQILINDTEETIIELTGFSINPTTHKWVANLNVIIKDHFGLDKNDALTYQNNHAGFAAWWLLQHTRGYRPFETQVKFKMDLIAE